MPSLRERLSQAASALFGSQTRGVPLPNESLHHWQGMAPLFKPAGSLKVYGDSPWLGGAVDRIA
ncbi:MAG: hypothetical protein IT428_06975 [Planctomycetaceae bacterium]|nr:hypothetical protein [Planctomycetaceae bacterium]